MPKKAQTRAAKTKPRARRQQPRPAQPTAATPPIAPSEPTAPVASAATSRRSAARRLPTVTVNYAYLKHDLKWLAVLAPSMVVLLVIAYFVFHTT